MKKTKTKSKKPNKRSSTTVSPLHRRISLHPATIFILLTVGVFICFSTYKTIAATSTSLTMRIHALPLKQPAIITKPADQTRFVVPDITVEGSCPDESYIKLYKDELLAGVALCEDGKFTIMTTLRSGANRLQVKVYNLTDVEGPRSGFITVFYDKPSSADPSNPKRPTNRGQTDPLRIIADYKYKVYKSGQPVTLDLALTGGLPPYAVAVEWDENHTTPIARVDRDPFQVKHVYEEMPRLYTHVIKVAASDPEGNADFVQLMAVIGGNEPTDTTPETETPVGAGTTNGPFDGWLIYVWPTYLIIVLMVLSFYLGEREERRILLHRKHKPILH